MDDGDGVDGIFVGSGDGAVEVGLKVGILDGYDDGLSVAKIGHKFPGGSSISDYSKAIHVSLMRIKKKIS